VTSLLEQTERTTVHQLPTEMIPKMLQLDGLRALAVFTVMFEHLYANKRWLNFIPWARGGVQLFFVLSGFLITAILLKCRVDAEPIAGRGLALRRFYIRRFLRIYPLYYFVLAVGWLLHFPQVRDHILWHAAYLSDFYFAYYNHWDSTTSHLWTLSVEEQFYLLWPWLMLFFPRRWLGRLIVATILVGPLYRLGGGLAGWRGNPLYTIPFASMDSLGLGAMLAYLREGKPGDAAKHEALRWAAFWVGIPLFIILTPLAYISDSTARVWVVGINLALSLCSFWLVDRAAIGFGGVPGALLQSKPLQYCGKISYGLYIYHLFMTRIPLLNGGIFSRNFPGLFRSSMPIGDQNTSAT
jgi:peptidoglycan/LPS O-acetylase OafA/YrhL